MASMNISVPDPMREWVERRIESGQYASVSDYVRDLIRRDQERAAKIAAMQRLVTEGLESGVAADFDFEAFQARMREEHGRREA